MDVERLRLLASAIAGRPLDVAAGAAGAPSWTDGTTVHLDPTLPPTDALLALAVQASLVAAGSLTADIVRSLHRRPALARRYLAVEGHRALAHNEALLPPVVLGAVDRSVATLSGSPAGSLAVARRRTSVPDAPPAFGELRTGPLLSESERAGHEAARRPPTEVQPLDDSDDDAIDLLSSPVGGGGVLGKLLRRLLAPARGQRGGGPPGADAATHRGSARPGAARRRALSPALVDAAVELPAAPPAGGITYPEWDGHRRRYRPAWCTVVEDDPTPTDGPTSPPADELALHRPLARLGIGLEHCRRRRQGDDVDVDAVVETRVDLAAGRPADEAGLYIEPLRRRRDLSVLVLLDVSGSAAEPGSAGKAVHVHQRRAAASLVAALHGLGDRVAVYAFNSRGRQAVQVLRVKAFDDHLDGAVGRRFDALVPGAYTRLGAAIRHGTAIVEARAGTPRRLLVVLSDGFAYDHGYEGRYGEADARRALLEARRRGVGCLCLSVGADVEPAALRRVFGTAAHATVPRVDELPAVVGPLFRAALRSAEAQHRAFQRERRSDAPLLRAGR